MLKKRQAVEEQELQVGCLFVCVMQQLAAGCSGCAAAPAMQGDVHAAAATHACVYSCLTVVLRYHMCLAILLLRHTCCQGRRGGVEAELAGVQPLIDQARKAVGQIKKENIDEIRSLKMPPDAIRDVLEVRGDV